MGHAVLSLALLADLVFPSTIGAMCGPHCPSNFSNTTFGFVAFLTAPASPWVHMPYVFGESSLDLWAAATLRCALVIVIAILRNRRRVRPSSAKMATPLLQPLNAETIGSPFGSVYPSDAVSRGGRDAVPPVPSENLPAMTGGSMTFLSANQAWWSSWTLVALTWSHCTAKGLARLVQGGTLVDGDGFGLLPLDGTTPPERQFWVCVLVAAMCAEIERRALLAISAPISAEERKAEEEAAEAATALALNGRDGGGGGGANGSHNASNHGRGGSGGDAATSAAEMAAAAAAKHKESYIRRTTPEVRNTLGFIFRMLGPDWHLLLWAYFSLVLAALGESLVPMLYGQVIDAIAIQPDMGRFREYMLLLIGTALSTGIFTGFRGSTFIIIGGRFGKRLRIRLFKALLRQELDFFGATKTGDVTSRLSADCQMVSEQVQLNVNVFLRSLIQACFTFVRLNATRASRLSHSQCGWTAFYDRRGGGLP